MLFTFQFRGKAKTVSEIRFYKTDPRIQAALFSYTVQAHRTTVQNHYTTVRPYKLYTTSPPYDRIKPTIRPYDRTSPQCTTIRMHKATIRSYKPAIYTIVRPYKPTVRSYKPIIRPYECTSSPYSRTSLEILGVSIFRWFFIFQSLYSEDFLYSSHYIPKIFYIPSVIFQGFLNSIETLFVVLLKAYRQITFETSAPRLCRKLLVFMSIFMPILIPIDGSIYVYIYWSIDLV